jgi:hypothetical protein
VYRFPRAVVVLAVCGGCGHTRLLRERPTQEVPA